MEDRLAAGIYNFVCEQGATFRRTITWTDENGTPINLAGCSARMQVRNTHETTTPILSLISTGGSPGITLTTDTGQISLYISATDTAALDDGPKVYDLEVVMANGDVNRLMQGQFVVEPEVTR